MSFLKRLFGRADENVPYEDTRGVYFYVQCDHCGTRLRLRADKEYDLNRTAAGYEWHKTIVDSKCFRPMPTVVHLDRNYDIVSAEIEGGHYITEATYKRETEEAPAAGSGAEPTTIEEEDLQS